MRGNLSRMVFSAAACAALLVCASAQQPGATGQLKGTVVGANGAPVAFARVQLQGQAVYAAVSDVTGQFTVLNFKTGTYVINVRQNNNVQTLTQEIPAFAVTLTVKW